MSGFDHVVKNTHLQGRWQQIATNPKTILEVSHNKAGFQYVIQQLNNEDYHQLHIVLGFVKEKAVAEIIELLPADAFYYLCAPANPRALPTPDLCKLASHYSLNFSEHQSVAMAFANAQKKAKQGDFLLVTGSTFIVAEILQLKPL